MVDVDDGSGGKINFIPAGPVNFTEANNDISTGYPVISLNIGLMGDNAPLLSYGRIPSPLKEPGVKNKPLNETRGGPKPVARSVDWGEMALPIAGTLDDARTAIPTTKARETLEKLVISTP